MKAPIAHAMREHLHVRGEGIHAHEGKPHTCGKETHKYKERRPNDQLLVIGVKGRVSNTKTYS